LYLEIREDITTKVVNLILLNSTVYIVINRTATLKDINLVYVYNRTRSSLFNTIDIVVEISKVIL
jgi:hypothetical protein